SEGRDSPGKEGPMFGVRSWVAVALILAAFGVSTEVAQASDLPSSAAAVEMASAVASSAIAVSDYCEYCQEDYIDCEWVIANPENWHQTIVGYCNAEGEEAQAEVHQFWLDDWMCNGSSPGPDCAACGWTSQCHEYEWLGPCHGSCGL